MLLGGAWADRYSPRLIMLVSDSVRLSLTAFLAAAVLGGFVQMWMIYLLSVAFGVVSGLFMPAMSASFPRLLPEEHLERGNALLQGVNQLAQFAGPAAAGILIAVCGAQTLGGEEVANLTGVGVAFAIDAVTFAASGLSLWLLNGLPAGNGHDGKGTTAAVFEALRFSWGQPTFRWVFLLVAVSSLLGAGPIMVGVPVLADARLAEGAAALGLILSASGLGNLGGLALGGMTRRPRPRLLGGIIVALYVAFGFAMAALAYISSTWMALPIMVAVGLGNGYLAVVVISLLQRKTPKEMLGRIMSLLMLFMVGLTPISMTIAGALVKADPTLLFVGAGSAHAALGLVAASRKAIWRLGSECEFEDRRATRRREGADSGPRSLSRDPVGRHLPAPAS
jgi:MFS family permease